MSKNYNEGVCALAMMRFENPEIENSVSTNGFTVGPAYTLVNQEKSKFILQKNTKNPQFLQENARLEEELKLDEMVQNMDDDDEEESLEAFKARVKKQSDIFVKKEDKIKE